MKNRILVEIDGGLVSHFTLQEIVPVHPSVLESLERTRQGLNAERGGGIGIIITSMARSEADNEALADRLGWTDTGGLVSRTSKHLTNTRDQDGRTVGCVAADFYAVDLYEHERIPQRQVAAVARHCFDYVKYDYADGHVHGDNRYRTNVEPKP